MEIKILQRQGVSIRRIARQMGASRNTARDYLRFAQMLVDGGRFDGAQILVPATVALMTPINCPRN